MTNMNNNGFPFSDKMNNQSNHFKFDSSSSSVFTNEAIIAEDDLLSTPKPNRENTWFSVFLVGGYMVIIIIGITANLMVFMVALNNQWRRIGNRALSTMNTYIINLASADLLYIFGGIFWLIADTNSRGWLFGELGCRVVLSMDVITMYVGSYILTTMTIERYIAVVYPLALFRIRNITFARRICASIWFTALCLTLPVMIGARQSVVEKHGNPYVVCGGDSIYGIKGRNRYIMSVCGITFVIPSIVMLTVYTKMFKIICPTIPKSTLEASNNATRQLRRSSRRAAKIVFLIVAVYWCCYTPFWLNQILVTYVSSFVLLNDNIMGLVTLLLSYLNAMVNPFIYTLLPSKHNLCSSIRSKYRTSTIHLRNITSGAQFDQSTENMNHKQVLL